MPRPKSNKESERLRSMVHQHLRRRSPLTQTLGAGAHLDEDMLAAFTEGRLSETEAAPLIKHLVGCSSCRYITAQLIRLDTELEGEEHPASVPQEEPNRIRRLLSDLAARVLPSSDTEVFAYHAPADDFEKKDEAKDNGEPQGEEKPGE
jgi:Putative zinc-finger